MPVVGIVVGYVGASIGTAAFAGTALAGFGSAIGAGIAGGLYSSSQGGDFGKGFLMGAVGNYVGGQIGGMFEDAGGGLSEEAFQAADYANLAGQGFDAATIGQNMGAAAGNWGGVNAAAMMGDMASSSTGMGDIPMSDADFAASLGNPQGEFANVGVSDIGGPYDPMATQGTMGEWTPGGEQGYGVTTYPFDEAVNNPLATTATQTPPTLQDIVATKPMSYDSMGGDSSLGYEPNSLDNITASAPASGANPAGNFGTPTQSGGYMDRLKGWVSDSDAKLAKFGMPKGSTVLGLAGAGQYMMGNYETYKAEQIAKGMKPMTLEEFQNKMYNPNDYKTTANSMAQSGRTGTLPVLLARMKQQSAMDYSKNYLPTANQNWWDVNANISKQRTNNLGNLTQPLSMAWSMNQGKR